MYKVIEDSRQNRELLSCVRRGAKSVTEVFENRLVTIQSLNALEDIEADLEYALKAVRQLVAANRVWED
jgi:hypothetical protein